MSYSTCSSGTQVTQVISFTVLNDSSFEKRFSREGRRWTGAMETIRRQSGWIRTLYGHDMGSFHKVDLYVGKFIKGFRLFARSSGVDLDDTKQSGRTSAAQGNLRPRQHLKPFWQGSLYPRFQLTSSKSRNRWISTDLSKGYLFLSILHCRSRIDSSSMIK